MILPDLRRATALSSTAVLDEESNRREEESKGQLEPPTVVTCIHLTIECQQFPACNHPNASQNHI